MSTEISAAQLHACKSRKSSFRFGLLAATILGAAAMLSSPVDAQDSPVQLTITQDHAQGAVQPTEGSSQFLDRIHAADLLMGSNPNLQGMHSLCVNLKDWGTFRKGLSNQQVTLTPTKVFDNLYYMGFNVVGAWALVTKDGIIQIDALHTPEEAEQIIIPAYKKLGLDPAKIKYVILTHSHAEHWGGGKYFQDTYHSHIVMGGPDWDIVAKSQKPPAPTKDISVDGPEPYKLTLGGTTVTIYLSPGHTPGTLDLLVPVMDHGKPHLMSFVGGTGIPKGMDHMMQYRDSFSRFLKASEDAHADGVMSNHFWFDGTWIDGKTDKTAALARRKSGDPNPWVVGEDEVVRSSMADLECLESSMARLNETGMQ